MSGAPRRLDPCGSRTGQRPLLHIVRAVRSGAVHCVIGISSSARDQPGRGAPLPQLLGQVVGVLDGLRCCRRAHRSVGGLMIRAESPARKIPGRPAWYCRATWAPMLNPRTLRSVPRIWGRSLTSTARAGRPQYEPSRRRSARRSSSLLRPTRAWDRSRCRRRPNASQRRHAPASRTVCTAAGSGDTHTMSTRRPRSAGVSQVRLNYRRDRVVQGTPGPSTHVDAEASSDMLLLAPSAAMRYSSKYFARRENPLPKSSKILVSSSFSRILLPLTSTPP
jgi:hypothetical protein